MLSKLSLGREQRLLKELLPVLVQANALSLLGAAILFLVEGSRECGHGEGTFNAILL